nr:hypothetical protein [Oscillospiraceae bacterium]
MDRSAYWKIAQLAGQPQAQENTIAYLTEHLRHFLRKQERVLICFLEHKEGNISWLMEQAVLRCDAVPVIWGPDHKWKTLLQQAFFNRTTAIIGPPLILLGLAKLKRQSATPLYIRRCITAAYPCLDWMIDGIVRGFDCEMGGCMTMGESGIVLGFACGHSWGVHVRDSEYQIDIVDPAGELLPEGTVGEMVLFPKSHPQLRYPTGEKARLTTEVCKCGSKAPRLLELSPGDSEDSDLEEFRQYLHSWTSILDCRVERGENGLEIEIVCFAGEKLPKLPTAAMRIVRPWNPKTDEPFWYSPTLKNVEKVTKSH